MPVISGQSAPNIFKLNMAKRAQSKSALVGLRCMQKIGALAVPTSLEQVVEEVECKADILKPQIFSTDDWKNVEKAVKDIFRKEFTLNEPGKLFQLHQSVKNILRSKTGTFLCDCYREWLMKEMSFLSGKFKNTKGAELIQRLEEVWSPFYRDMLPVLEAVLYLLKPKGRLSVRSTALAVYRDMVFFAEDIEDAITREKECITNEFRHLILILLNVNDSYPPCKNRLRLEAIASQVFKCFMGYFGVYENGELIATSNEPAAFAKRRSSADAGPRRISRPFSVQPQQMETLNQMFKNAIRHKSMRISGIKE